MGNNYPCPECCAPAGVDCECECRHCQDIQAACCYIVQVEGLTNQDCADCGDLNREYFLLQSSEGDLGTGTGTGTGDCNALTEDTGTGTGTCGVCTWEYRVTEPGLCEATVLCGVENTLLTVTLTPDGERVFTFTLGDMQWEWVASGTADPAPFCCPAELEHIRGQDNPRDPIEYGVQMDLISSGDQCVEAGTAGGIEGVIATLSWADRDECAVSPPTCGDRITGAWPCCIQVEFSGTPAFATVDDDSCVNCDCYNGTIVNVESVGGFTVLCDTGNCHWNTFNQPSAPGNEICSFWDIYICLNEVASGSTGTGTDASGADYELKVVVRWFAGAGTDVVFKKIYEDPPEVAAFVDEEIPYFSGGDPDKRDCFWAGTGTGTFEDPPSMLLTGIIGGTTDDCITGDLAGECRLCKCNPLPTPDIKVVVSGITTSVPEEGCDDCEVGNGTFILSIDESSSPCIWRFEIGDFCGGTGQYRLDFDQLGSGLIEATLTFRRGTFVFVEWQATITTDPVRPINCQNFGPISLPLTGGVIDCPSDGTAATIESV